ncbi:MAG: ligand-binding SRPBCC domain-containing protein [Bacteroidia bacterium]|jgi:ligand-binding SRPBCC domain-containing protein
MPTIQTLLNIQAPIDRVFDLSRSIDLHIISTQQTHERAIAGRTSGLIDLGETVTWRAKHFGIYQTLTSQITNLHRPFSFTDEMVQGIFKSFKHQHKFTNDGIHTLLTDIFDYEAPFGILGHAANVLFLKWYMRRLLERRNNTIKAYAETDMWKAVLKTS